MLLTTADAARIINVSPSRIRQLISEERIKATKNGRDWSIERAELDGYDRKKPGRKPKKQEV